MPNSRYRLDVVALSVVDTVSHAGGWLFDRVMGGWDVTVYIPDLTDVRPLQILGAQIRDLDDAFVSLDQRPRPRALAFAADLFARDLRARKAIMKALDHTLTEVTLWGEARSAELDESTDSVQHRLSAAARVFKVQALAAAQAPAAFCGFSETFRSRLIARPPTADLVRASCHVS
ncbi:hypothetical protein [Mycobacterium parmense]|uniref:hypothetical protein n=1 Tax=Mycobacterium parmense TaxID=185642 RepID=UPI000A168EBC|nr:hypothetical protein [Mycobacterium parmense]MCV7352340.1 hypothetical protein [Mycobacterium parmense]ORW56309.1 hypothetical protein AWC20_16545 [Mycobacterium parmense]